MFQFSDFEIQEMKEDWERTNNNKVIPLDAKNTILEVIQEELLNTHHRYFSSSQEIFMELLKKSNVIDLSMTSHFFENIAKAKALNLLMRNLELKKVVRGISDSSEFSIYDKYNNSLRTLLHQASALCSSLDKIICYPCDLFFKHQSSKNLRLVNTSFQILKEESGFGKVNDPLRGSYYVESRALEISREVCEYLQNLEISNFQESQEYKKWLSEGITKKKDLVLNRSVNISGVNNFVNLEEVIKLSEIKDHKSEVFFQERLRSKIQELKLKAKINYQGELKDYISQISKVSNFYFSFGVEVIINENSKSDFFTNLDMDKEEDSIKIDYEDISNFQFNKVYKTLMTHPEVKGVF